MKVYGEAMNKIATHCHKIYSMRTFLSEQRKLDKVRRAQANPMSIYEPDPRRLAVCGFNARLSEIHKEMKERLNDFVRMIEVERTKNELYREISQQKAIIESGRKV